MAAFLFTESESFNGSQADEGFKLLSQNALKLLALLIATFSSCRISPAGNTSLVLASVSVWNRYRERDDPSKPLLAFNALTDVISLTLASPASADINLNSPNKGLGVEHSDSLSDVPVEGAVGNVANPLPPGLTEEEAEELRTELTKVRTRHVPRSTTWLQAAVDAVEKKPCTAQLLLSSEDDLCL